MTHLTLTAAIVFTASAYAVTIRVPADAPTLQAGIDAAATGDTVLVAPGTYVGAENRDISFHGVDLVLRSEGGASSTVIDCERQGRGFNLVDGESRMARIEGFTVVRGEVGGIRLPRNCGGGIRLISSTATISNCIIRDCIVEDTFSSGGGIYCDNSSLLLVDCIIADCTNRGDFGIGGGLYSWGSSLTLIRCAITGNVGEYAEGGGCYISNSDASLIACTITHNDGVSGGGLKLVGSPPATLENCVITRNVGHNGGGLLCSNSSPVLTNCTFVDNTSLGDGGGIYSSAGTRQQLILKNCILWGDEPDEINWTMGSTAPRGTFSNIQGTYPGHGNIDVPPRFLPYRGFRFALSNTSPCIDTGDPDMQDGKDWADPFFPPHYHEANSSACDMGAYGGPQNRVWLSRVRSLPACPPN